MFVIPVLRWAETEDQEFKVILSYTERGHSELHKASYPKPKMTRHPKILKYTQVRGTHVSLGKS